MKNPRSPLMRLLFTASAALCLAAVVARAQQPPPAEAAPAQDEDEVVQTGVTVFDKQGRFVENPKAEDFVLQVDGKSQAVSFFDRVTAGGTEEANRLARVPGAPPLASLAPGRYVLQVSVHDRAARKAAEWRVSFEVR